MSRISKTPELAAIEGRIVAETLKAVLFEAASPNGKPVKVWVPKSQITKLTKGEPETETTEGTPDFIHIPEWIADRNNWDY